MTPSDQDERWHAQDQIHAARSSALPFVQLATAVIRDEALSANARTMYAIIATFVSLDTREYPLYRSTLAKLLGKSVDTADRTIAELQAYGLLSVVPQWTPAGQPTASRFVLHDVELGVPDRSRGSRMDAHTRTGAPTPGSRMGAGTGTSAEGGSRTSAEGVAAPVRHITRDKQEPSPEPTTTPAAAAATEADDPALFDLQGQKSDPPQRRTRASKPPTTPDPVREHADRLCRPWWESLNPRPAGKRAYPNAVDVVMTVVDKWTDLDITAVLARCGRTVSSGSLNFQYDRIKEENSATPRRGSRSTTTDRVMQAQSLKRGPAQPSHLLAIGGGQ